jgi:hypothetical protein
VEFRLNGQMLQLDAGSVTIAATRTDREDIREHWVDVRGRRWPPKQLFAAATGIPRSEFTSHIALRLLQRVGFTTSDIPTAVRPRVGSPPPSLAAEPVDGAVDAFRELVTFVSAEELTRASGGWRATSTAATRQM